MPVLEAVGTEPTLFPQLGLVTYGYVFDIKSHYHNTIDPTIHVIPLLCNIKYHKTHEKA